MSGLNDAVNTQTGGNSFCYIDFDPATFTNGSVNNAGMTVIRVGKYPLHGLNARIIDQTKISLAVNTFLNSNPDRSNRQEFVKHLFAIQSQPFMDSPKPITDFGTEKKFLADYPLTFGYKLDVDVVFNAFNGSWVERMSIRTVNGKWTKALLVERGQTGQKNFWKIDPDYPRVNGKLDVNWPRPAKGKPEWEQ